MLNTDHESCHIEVTRLVALEKVARLAGEYRDADLACIAVEVTDTETLIDQADKWHAVQMAQSTLFAALDELEKMSGEKEEKEGDK